ncbi:MAG: MFS transporter [Vicinamibacteraceae bacterium]
MALHAEVVDTRSAGREAVLSMALCVMVLIASEFMPVSLLTPIASDLRMTEGQAGQAISISGLFAVLTSLFVAAVTARLDRRTVLLSLTVLMIVSGTLVATAPNFAILMLGRALLGVAIGGFWSMSTATVMRLVPDERVPHALAILNGGNALAATIAAPLGSFVGGIIGWRGTFFCVVPLAAVALAWQLMTIPSMRSDRQSVSMNVFTLLARPPVAYGMAAIMLLFMGQFALFTYLRPFLETVTKVDVSALSLMLLAVGVAGLIGTSLIGSMLNTQLYSLGASLGGFLFDMSGYQSTFAVSAVVLCAAAFLALKAGRVAVAAEVAPDPQAFDQRSASLVTRRSSVVDFTL